MTNTNATNFRRNAFSYFDQAIQFNDIINVTTKNGNAVVMSEEDFNGLMETCFLLSVPGMRERLTAAVAEPLEESEDFAW